MSDAPRDPTPKGFTLDLSTGRPATGRPRKRKGPPPVVVQTINLSTKTTTEATPATEPVADTRRDTAPRPTKPSAEKRSRPSSGNSLADLLDEATLARLRGEG